MAKINFRFIPSSRGIYANYVDHANNEESEDVTNSVIHSVASFMIQENKHIHIRHKEDEYVLKVVKINKNT